MSQNHSAKLNLTALRNEELGSHFYKGKALGQGAFGEVTLMEYDGQSLQASHPDLHSLLIQRGGKFAVKKLKKPPGISSAEWANAQADFERERNLVVEYSEAYLNSNSQQESKLPVGIAATIAGVPSIIFDYLPCEGNMESFFGMLQANAHVGRNRANLGVKYGQMMYDAYEGLAQLHAENILHLDFSLRNCLPLFGNPVAEAKLTDLGFARKLPDGKEVMKEVAEKFSILWSSPLRLQKRLVTKQEDLHAFRVSLLEVAAGLSGNYDNFYRFVSPTGNYCSRDSVATWVHAQHSSDYVFAQFYDNVLKVLKEPVIKEEDDTANDLIAKVSMKMEAKMFIESFQMYLVPSMENGKRFEQLKPEEDKQLLLHCYDKYITAVLREKLFLLQTDAISAKTFAEDVTRLLASPSTPFFKNGDLYSNAKDLVSYITMQSFINSSRLVEVEKDQPNLAYLLNEYSNEITNDIILEKAISKGLQTLSEAITKLHRLRTPSTILSAEDFEPIDTDVLEQNLPTLKANLSYASNGRFAYLVQRLDNLEVTLAKTKRALIMSEPLIALRRSQFEGSENNAEPLTLSAGSADQSSILNSSTLSDANRPRSDVLKTRDLRHPVDPASGSNITSQPTMGLPSNYATVDVKSNPPSALPSNYSAVGNENLTLNNVKPSLTRKPTRNYGEWSVSIKASHYSDLKSDPQVNEKPNKENANRLRSNVLRAESSRLPSKQAKNEKRKDSMSHRTDVNNSAATRATSIAKESHYQVLVPQTELPKGAKPSDAPTNEPSISHQSIPERNDSAIHHDRGESLRNPITTNYQGLPPSTGTKSGPYANFRPRANALRGAEPQRTPEGGAHHVAEKKDSLVINTKEQDVRQHVKAYYQGLPNRNKTNSSPYANRPHALTEPALTIPKKSEYGPIPLTTTPVLPPINNATKRDIHANRPHASPEPTLRFPKKSAQGSLPLTSAQLLPSMKAELALNNARAQIVLTPKKPPLILTKKRPWWKNTLTESRAGLQAVFDSKPSAYPNSEKYRHVLDNMVKYGLKQKHDSWGQQRTAKVSQILYTLWKDCPNEKEMLQVLNRALIDPTYNFHFNKKHTGDTNLVKQLKELQNILKQSAVPPVKGVNNLGLFASREGKSSSLPLSSSSKNKNFTK
ncbi:MAG: protein kinase [Gammaproteobacteria bacterium]|nr:protein kinase [Gammaproteobacteria bacterium]